ncbi:L,D-transpeptidase [Clostridium estertheticum]|uniref:L,D-transpeptidase n=1 Tax=Clostridium estertheticum TaxID=238834 RepID=A0A7Y3T3N4_9CLOT|nr:L,D-transpeptidase [Clostridium estertheticum]MBW9173734.1 L,D-transpeptidase [Clostridium estertheticum]NNU78694.1 L,D-transpeptidase [Clostridium estertheticum]WBL46766.1 L,D-transpeptidase [Clostridium estertheticum]WLC74936.1 L,D-transpeptidase [Clostridium estertheticum]
MNKSHLSCILFIFIFIFIIILIVFTLDYKADATVKSPLTQVNIYQNNDILMKNNIIKTNVQKPVYSSVTTNNPLEKVINSKNIWSATSYFIWIDIYHQRVNIFKGSYKKWHLVTSMVCSTGKTSTPTIKGNFAVGIKGKYFISSGGARCKYYTQIRGNYLFHSVLYDRGGNYIIDNTLGVPVSHGCVRLALKNAKFIYDYIPAKTFIWSN